MLLLLLGFLLQVDMVLPRQVLVVIPHLLITQHLTQRQVPLAIKNIYRLQDRLQCIVLVEVILTVVVVVLLVVVVLAMLVDMRLVPLHLDLMDPHPEACLTVNSMSSNNSNSSMVVLPIVHRSTMHRMVKVR